MLSYNVNCFVDCLLSPGIRAADQLLCDGAGKHCFGSGALQWTEGGENLTELLYVYMSVMKDVKPEQIHLQHLITLHNTPTLTKQQRNSVT